MPSLQSSHFPQGKHPRSEAGDRLSLAVAKLDTLILRVSLLTEFANQLFSRGDGPSRDDLSQQDDGEP